MKKILVVLLLFVSANVYAEYKNSLVLKSGITPYSILKNEIYWNMGGVFHTNETEKTSGNFGFSIGAEYFRSINKLLLAGIGLSQCFSTGIDGNNLYSLSIYLTPKINIYKNMYLTAQFGGNYIDTKESNRIAERGWKWEKKIGLHYGIGMGYSYKNFIFEFLYSSDNAVYEFYIDTDILGNPFITATNNVNYQTFNFNVGYKFDFNFSEIKRNNKEKQINDKKVKEVKKSERELLIEQNELLKKQIELLQQNKSEGQENEAN